MEASREDFDNPRRCHTVIQIDISRVRGCSKSDLAEEIREYQAYGKPQLVKICEFLGLDAAQWDDGVRTDG